MGRDDTASCLKPFEQPISGLVERIDAQDELARVAPGVTKSWDTAGLLRFCDTLRRTENSELAEAIMAYFKKGERAGYFRIATIRPER